MKLYEVGPVVFPAYTETSVGVRSREFAAILSDPTALGDLARALVLGTPPDEAARPGTSDDGAADPQGAASEHSGMTRDARARLLALHS